MIIRIVKMKFGSHLYGTNTPQSDIDWRSVIIPPGRDILLQKRNFDAFHMGPLKNPTDKNKPGDIDETAYSLQKFLHLASQGEIGALDMLYAPASWLDQSSSVWEEIQANKNKIVTNQINAFVGYCRQQAAKYGIKGSRVSSARAALDFLKGNAAEFGSVTKLMTVADKIAEFAILHEHVEILGIKQANGTIVNHFEVCNKKLPYTINLKQAVDIIQRIVDEYGHRALQAERNEGVDWKALSHAVRAGYQALELFQTGTITFPRPEAEQLTAIKTGALTYAPVSAIIEKLLEDVEEASENSTLPDKADLQWIDDFVCKNYKAAILQS